jgi:hypothetical protein
MKAPPRFTVVYVPFGLIEWHGRHVPLRTDVPSVCPPSARSIGGAFNGNSPDGECREQEL